MLRFPVATLIRFCHNHGLLQISGRPQWLTVRGGSRQYVSRMLERIPDLRLSTPVLAVRRDAGGAGVHVLTARGQVQFDEVIFACHSDQALRILGADATPPEREVLGAIRYRPNRAVLHTDTALLPRRQRAWAAWNHEHAAAAQDGGQGVCLHYLINLLQPLPFKQPVLVSLNPLREPRADQVIAQFEYEHPVFDAAAILAQQQLPSVQGRHHTWFCGAWAGYGFHEDGLKSALDVVLALRARRTEALAA
jgi:predicted NAD/FAD-binding protein